MRVDTGIEYGSTVSPFYDSMVAKVIAHGATRDEAIRRLDGWLSTRRAPRAGDQPRPAAQRPAPPRRSSPATCTPASSTSTRAPTRSAATSRLAAAAAALAEQAANRAAAGVLAGIPSGWRNNPAVDQVARARPRRAADPRRRTASAATATSPSTATALDATVVVGDARRGRVRRRRAAPPLRRRPGTATSASSTPTTATSRSPCCPATPTRAPPLAAGSLVAPMPGNVLRVLVAAGDAVDGRPAARRRRGDEDGAPGARPRRRHGGRASTSPPGEQVDTGQVLLQMEETVPT